MRKWHTLLIKVCSGNVHFTYVDSENVFRYWCRYNIVIIECITAP